jgi:hypothetical protein
VSSKRKVKAKSSWVWEHFKSSPNGDKTKSFCLLCCQDIHYGKSRSTGMLEHHIKIKHTAVYSDRCEQHALERIEQETMADKSSMQSSINSYLTACPNFESCLIRWMVKKYMPLDLTECNEFQEMCRSLNKRSPVLGRDRNGRLLKEEFHVCHQKLVRILKGKYFSLTTDAWTSIAKTGYVTCTAHFIDKDTWVLHNIVLGLYEKTGRSRAVDCVQYVENQMELYNLHYSCMTSVVTDTEATMVAAGRLFIQHASAQNAKTRWYGCVDHLLELVTRIAFKDTPESLSAMSACHTIVNFFNSSSQAMNKLLSKQEAGRAVKPIQDVVTRWWSTYSMVDHLLRLKMYLIILGDEGVLEGNLTEQQWKIITDLKTLLQPFMIAQRLLEG